MTVKKLIEEFRTANPDFPEYILDELLEIIPEKTKDADVKKIINNVNEEYNNSLISYNEAIGVITAQSVGAPSTQMTLNTFHFAGIASQSVEGLPRLIEILDAKKNLQGPMMKLYLKNKKTSENEFKLIGEKIKETKLLEFTLTTDIDLDEKLVKIELDVKKLKKLEIKLESLISFLDKKIKKSAEIENNFIIIKGKSTAVLKEIIAIKELALNSIVYGIKGIKDVSLLKENGEFMIVTQGSALKHILNMEEIDQSRVYSNDIFEMYENYGIEVARLTIINEMMEVVKSQGLSINERHVLLIADSMTFLGEVKGMTRYGIVADKLNVLTRASFETPLKHLSKGALMNEENKLSSITENVMTNQIINVGTGVPKISVKKN